MLLRTQSHVCYEFCISGNTTSAMNIHSAKYIMKKMCHPARFYQNLTVLQQFITKFLSDSFKLQQNHKY